MNKTHYFISAIVNHTDIEKALQEVIKKRDEFITKNKIINVANESIQAISIGAQNVAFQLIMTFTYF
jgi:hypothetical protein